MKISIIGATGFIGGFLSEKFSKKFDVLNLSIRNEDLSNIKESKIEELFSSEIIINCASSLNPKTKNDYFLNEKFLGYLLSLNIKYQRKIIHLSTINTLIADRIDSYSISKKKCENEIKNSKNLFLIRLPLIYFMENDLIQPKGNLLKIFNYLKKIKLPIYPMIYPGHIYQPLEINSVKHAILKIIEGRETVNVINLVGEEKKCLWDIFNEIAKNENKKTLKLDLRFFYKILPAGLKLIIKKQNNFIQQIATIDHSKF